MWSKRTRVKLPFGISMVWEEYYKKVTATMKNLKLKMTQFVRNPGSITNMV